MKYDSAKEIKIKCRKEDEHLVPIVLADAYAIAKHINAMPCEIKLNPYGSGGLSKSSRRGNPITVGIKGGYKRKMLLHEMLHVKGYSHGPKRNGMLNFQHVVSRDTFSAQVEKEIFENHPYVFV